MNIDGAFSSVKTGWNDKCCCRERRKWTLFMFSLQSIQAFHFYQIIFLPEFSRDIAHQAFGRNIVPAVVWVTPQKEGVELFVLQGSTIAAVGLAKGCWEGREEGIFYICIWKKINGKSRGWTKSIIKKVQQEHTEDSKINLKSVQIVAVNGRSF